MSTPDGQGIVILRRLDALQRAIEGRSWQDVEWHYDNVRSAVERRLGVRGRPQDQPGAGAVPPPDVLAMQAAAAETDTFTFTITNPNPDRGLTLSAEAIEVVGDQFKAWVAARLLRQWQTTGVAPKFANIDVKVGLE